MPGIVTAMQLPIRSAEILRLNGFASSTETAGAECQAISAPATRRGVILPDSFPPS